MDNTNALPIIVVLCANSAHFSRIYKNYLHIVNTLKLIYPTPNNILPKVEREPVAQTLCHPPC